MLLKNIVFILLFLALPASSFAETRNMQVEIDHLLKFIRESGCAFVRNGKAHAPEAAVQHIQEKYSYFKDKIDSTEKFIDLCASRSTITGNLYKISCPGAPLTGSGNWLLKELKRFRNN